MRRERNSAWIARHLMTYAGSMRRFFGSYWGRIVLITGTAALASAVFFTPRFAPKEFSRSLIISLVYSYCIGPLCGLILPRLASRSTGLPPLVAWALVVATLLVLSVIDAVLASAILVGLGIHPAGHLGAAIWTSLRICTTFALVIGIGMVLYETLRGRLDVATQELETVERERARVRALATEARLASLESRLHPHFLFNALNAITALIHDDPARAEAMIERLAALLRVSLDASRRGTIPLAEELKIIQDYLEIEQARLGHRLRYGLEIPEELASIEVPPLSIQTLVENSVTHAVAPQRAGGDIRVGGGITGNRLWLAVTDTGPGFSRAAIRPGHGLHNLQERLEVQFGTEARLDIATSGGRTTVTMSLPLDRTGPEP